MPGRDPGSEPHSASPPSITGSREHKTHPELGEMRALLVQTPLPRQQLSNPSSPGGRNAAAGPGGRKALPGMRDCQKEMIFPAGIQGGGGESRSPPAPHQGRARCAQPGMLRLSQAERFPAFQILMEKAECCLPQAPRRQPSGLLNVKSFPQENGAGRVVGSFFQGEWEFCPRVPVPRG